MADGFDEFWKVYPKKVAKGDARKAWTQTSKLRPPIDKILKSVYAARASKQWMKDEGEYIPHPSTWLRQERWDDEHEVDLSQLNSSTGKVCGYCGIPSVGSIGGIYHCRAHADDAMTGKRTNVVSMKVA
jgi:hypothetical protein